MRAVLSLILAVTIATVAATAFAQHEKIAISDLHAERNQYNIGSITGIATNRTNNSIRYVSIGFNLYDKQRNQVGTAMANGSDLEPRGRWKFNAITTVPFATFEVSKIDVLD